MNVVELLTDVVAARRRQWARAEELRNKGGGSADEADEALVILRLAEVDLERARDLCPGGAAPRSGGRAGGD